MRSPISDDSHNTFRLYSIEDAQSIFDYIQTIISEASSGRTTPYTKDMFLRHARANLHELGLLIESNHKRVVMPIKASLIFWLYRSTTAMNITCPVHLPHVCKIRTPIGEKFFVTTKEEWMAHRDATTNQEKVFTISDHAKLQYLQRVLNVDIDYLLKDFPIDEMKGKAVKEGRSTHEVGDFIYICEDNVCVTILSKGMVTTK